jgi:hypothetical protein
VARRSIDSRMDRILNRILPPGSIERAEYELPEDMKQALRLHRSKASAIISGVVNRDGPGAAYARLLEGDLILPALPVQLREALGLVEMPAVTEDMTAAEAGEIYQRMIEGGQQ